MDGGQELWCRGVLGENTWMVSRMRVYLFSRCGMGGRCNGERSQFDSKELCNSLDLNPKVVACVPAKSSKASHISSQNPRPHVPLYPVSPSKSSPWSQSAQSSPSSHHSPPNRSSSISPQILGSVDNYRIRKCAARFAIGLAISGLNGIRES
ncbi:uncharacterized protein BDR25DRAFT_31539 [Lindgomyces ingoldianus]|uniref:Uncharacterized protein n=1 Tax=Lindgomyces ingoldianus TaxID=673940 RepID=A0ACB6QUE4_9PLEO|nr:uncharacterized protein BDR25DRAFT_31539 [Lindgomyces ingoldianus]KAF2470644.1 hypothetical protein BDR25DRAFT_31539 [Lindgomyces ingoldianus]